MAYHCTGCDSITLQPLGGFKPNPTERNPQQTKGYLPAAPPVGEFCVHCNQRHHVSTDISFQDARAYIKRHDITLRKIFV